MAWTTWMLLVPQYRRLLNLSLILNLNLLLLWSCQSPEPISFNDQIRPILNNNCLNCHGGVRQLGDFSLLFPETAFALTESGKRAIVPGNHQKSELYRRLVHEDPQERMPQEAPALSEAQIKLIADWIDQGAQWEDHWAYVAPASAAPPVQDSQWTISGMDDFVLKKLQEIELEPAAPAQPSVLARRASLDLTGLPPSGIILERYLRDPSESNYETLLDSLLASPHFGERWAAMWLDLARYADSNGYETDNHRNIWRFRDWVVQAFNRDLPFDQFTIEQLAGDLLPDPSRDQIMATAFHRNTMTNTEGGTIDEEFRLTSVMDRLNTTFEVWQSTSIGCVQCHSHPYDPFKQEEYYQLLAYFNNTQDADLSSLAPTLATWEPMDEEKIRSVISYIDQISSLNTDEASPLSSQIKAALYPRLIPKQCDDFQNVLINSDGSVSNQVYNFKESLRKRLYFKFEAVEIEGLQAIQYHFATRGTDAGIKVYLDHLDGELIQEIRFPYTTPEAEHVWEQEFVKASFPVSSTAGSHNLVFELINHTAKAPDGLVTIKEIELQFNNPQDARLTAYQQALLGLLDKADQTPVMKAKTGDFERNTRFLERGSWLTPLQEVHPKLPGTFQTQPIGTDRLALARWLVSEDNPLTARVIANRLWEQIFGNGIVLTVEDFGTQAEKATHPQLLDYLALRFKDHHQWSIKHFLKEILMSATYRQSSQVTPLKLEVDPYNRMMSRGPRFRLSAEQIRDQALAVSGLLDTTVGGESVMPPQPEGIWQVIYNAQKWETNQEDQYRRGLYTYWKRTAPYPSMVSFDSPSREFCVSRRIRTNTPLQALVTLNDPVYVEAAAALAKRMNQHQDPEEAIKSGYKLALMREPPGETLTILRELYQQAQQEMDKTPFKKVTWSSHETVQDPMIVVANAILNLDSFIMKE